MLVVKVPRLSDDNDRLRHEATNLRAVHTARPGGFDSIPHLVAYENYRHNPLLIQTALVGRPMSPKLVRRQPETCVSSVTRWLTEFHQTTARQSADTTGWYERLVEQPIRQFLTAMPPLSEELKMVERGRALSSVLRGHDIPLVFEHGDLGPTNLVLINEGRLGVLDWELAEPIGLPAIDLFFFLTLVAFSRRQARSHTDYVTAFHEAFFGRSAWAGLYINIYVKRLQLSSEMLRPLFVLCWSRYVASLVKRLHDFDVSDKPLKSETARWLRSNRYYALWRHTIKHIEALNLQGIQ